MGKVKEMTLDEFNHQISIYDNDIELYTDEYINNLSDESLIYKTMIFNGLLHYLYNKIFKVARIDNDNTYMLEHIIDIYIDICYRYNHIPSILGFSTLTGISVYTINDWIHERYRTDTTIVSIDGLDNMHSHSQSMKRLKSICEHALLSNATENNSIGSIFALKANYNYSDQPKPESIAAHETETISIDDIKQRYQLGDITKPDLSE